ncbi:MAG TPA: response regulator transcription factor, partial [Terriglobales bacterium]|nr:response regulator transcription factor [Terriglobales bacterium]
EAVDEARSKHPHVAIVDISMPGVSGIEAAKEIRSSSPKTRVVVLTMHGTPAHLEAALAAGCSGYVLKRSLDSALITAIRTVHDGGNFVDRELTQHLVRSATGQSKRAAISPAEVQDLLSARELQVLRLLATGHTNQEIADQIFVSVKSVETYRARIFEKLGVKRRHQLVQYALEAGLLQKAPQGT